MEEGLQNILHPGEIQTYVISIEPTSIEEIGSLRWFDKHERMQMLNQQSVLEAGDLREESVKEAFVSCSKVPVLVHEAICVSVWKWKVFPFLLQSSMPMANSFMPYMVLYHEVTAVALLETILFHQDGCEALDETSIDLIDYCASAVIGLVALQEQLKEEKTNITPKEVPEELKNQQNVLAYDIGMRSITILSYLAQALDRLPLYARTRIYQIHDIPMMFLNLTDTNPWTKMNEKGETMKYIEGKWKKVDGEERMMVTKNEAQTWLCLRQLLLDPQCFDYYEFNDYRKAKLLKLQGKLHDGLVDQISPLIELKQWLNYVSVSCPPTSNKTPILLEVLPQINKKILTLNKGKWKQIIKKHEEFFCKSNRSQMLEVANRLRSTFDIDTLSALAGESRKCSGCGEPASKRCSRCKAHWFCGRECQVKNWGMHKPLCDKIIELSL